MSHIEVFISPLATIPPWDPEETTIDCFRLTVCPILEVLFLLWFPSRPQVPEATELKTVLDLPYGPY